MRKALGVALAGAVLACSPARSPDPVVSFDSTRAVISQAASGGSLTPASNASPVAIVAQFLRAKGASDATVGSLRQAGLGRSSRTGLSHVRVEQEVNGLRVLGAYVKAAVGSRGELKHVIDNSAPVSGTPAAAQVTEADALRAALAVLHPQLTDVPAATRRQGNVTTFGTAPFFYEAPTVERVALLLASGTLSEGFLVQTWTAKDNLLHHTTVDAAGKVVDVELRTANDSYRVFRTDPVKTPQEVVLGPVGGASPQGWLFAGPQRTIDIAGNNVRAYLDAVNDSIPDPGGDTLLDGNFLALADLTITPADPVNRAVAVQNLFYLNNVVHDELYAHGFTETAGNFQQNNFGRDPHDGDAVRAEAQDGGGTDNANFATPVDGHAPRMQMYLWHGRAEVTIDAPEAIAGGYRAQAAAFGAPLDESGVTGDIALVDDGVAATSDACDAIPNDLTGKIALLDRGTCAFVTKVKNAQNAGAIAVIVANNANDSLTTMGGTDATITIPAVFIGKTDGAKLKSGLAAGLHGSVREKIMRDGDLDSDIVWHEYGHGLTWRMIGRMQGPLAGAVGEGMSDVLAIILNEDDVVGEYAFDAPAGIRRAPYTNYHLHYGYVQGTEVHDDGEIYAAIGWRLFQLYRDAGIPKDVLLDELIDGMNYTPSSPKFEDMRDGILASIANSPNPEHACLVWHAFAKFGVGVGAWAQVANGEGLTFAPGATTFKPTANVRVSASFDVPTSCQP